MASINKIDVNGALYDIDLPSTATPSIASLTVNGDTTIGGILSTAAGVTISKDLTVGGNLTGSGTSGVTCAKISCSGDGSVRYLNSQILTATSVSAMSILCPRLKANSSAGSLMVPTTSGTLALTSDIPTVPTFSAITSNEINLMFI